MKFVVPGIILFFCVPAFFVNELLIKPILILSGIAGVLGALAMAWAYGMPANFLIEHPALADTPLQPVMASLLGGLLLLFAVGLLLVLGARVVWHNFETSKK